MLKKIKMNLLTKKKEIFTSKSPSTGLNVKPFFTVSAVNSSLTKKKKINKFSF